MADDTQIPEDIDKCVGDGTYVTRHQAHQIGKRAGQAAAVEILTAIGINATSPKDIIQVQVDMAHLRRERLAAEEAPKIIKKAAITVFVTGIIAILILGFRAWLNNNTGHI